MNKIYSSLIILGMAVTSVPSGAQAEWGHVDPISAGGEKSRSCRGFSLNCVNFRSDGQGAQRGDDAAREGGEAEMVQSTEDLGYVVQPVGL